jgi:hypothetical protein
LPGSPSQRRRHTVAITPEEEAAALRIYGYNSVRVTYDSDSERRRLVLTYGLYRVVFYGPAQGRAPKTTMSAAMPAAAAGILVPSFPPQRSIPLPHLISSA